MGKWRAFRLGITKGMPSLPEHPPACPREHDDESLERIANKWRYSLVLNRVDGAKDLTIAIAISKHNKMCWPDQPKHYCPCDWCENRREMLGAKENVIAND